MYFSISEQDKESRLDEMADSTSDAPPQDTLTDAESQAALRSSAVKYLTYNRNLLPMFAGPGQLWHKRQVKNIGTVLQNVFKRFNKQQL